MNRPLIVLLLAAAGACAAATGVARAEDPAPKKPPQSAAGPQPGPATPRPAAKPKPAAAAQAKADKEPKAAKEPNAVNKPAADKKPSADKKPNAGRKPEADKPDAQTGPAAGANPAAESGAEEPQAGSESKPKDDPNLGMSILGNQEAPKSLVIVPWKSSDLGKSLDLSTMLDDSRQPIDKDVFMRVLRYYDLRSTTTRPEGAAAGGPKTGGAGNDAAQPATAPHGRKP
jgi:hypothetical protein